MFGLPASRSSCVGQWSAHPSESCRIPQRTSRINSKTPAKVKYFSHTLLCHPSPKPGLVRSCCYIDGLKSVLVPADGLICTFPFVHTSDFLEDCLDFSSTVQNRHDLKRFCLWPINNQVGWIARNRPESNSEACFLRPFRPNQRIE